MSLPLVFAAIWVVTAAFVAMLPMRLQYPPGLALLIAAPCLLGWIAVTHGGWVAILGMVAFISMFRHPLRYLARRVLRQSENVQ